MFIKQLYRFQFRHVLPPLPYLAKISALEHLDHFLQDLSRRIWLPATIAVIPLGLPSIVYETSAQVKLPVGIPFVDVNILDWNYNSRILRYVLS